MIELSAENRQVLIEHVRRHRYIYILTAVLLLLNIREWVDLVENWWEDDNYSHGFLIIPVSIYLLWQKRTELVFPAATSRTGLLILAMGCFGYLFGIAAGEYFTTRFSMVLLLTGLSWSYLGNGNFRRVWFAFFFLLFMIPIPATIYFAATGPMQLLASKITNGFLHFIGVSSVRQGNIINLPDYRLEVAEACSGLRSLVSLMALTAFYAHTQIKGRTNQVFLFIASIPIAIATNVMRIVLTAIGAYAISTEIADSFLHEVSGTFVFIAALIMIMILGAILNWIKKRLSSS